MSALLATFAMLAAVTVPRTEKPVLVSLGCDGRTAPGHGSGFRTVDQNAERRDK